MLKKLFLTLAVTLLALPCLAQDGAAYKSILDNNADSIVTVRTVLKIDIPAANQSQENTMYLQACVVDASGLIMLSNSPISAERILESMAGQLPPNFELNITPSDFKVIFGNEEKEYEAYLVAKDTKLDLAFLQVKNLEGRQLKAVSFAGGAKPTIGQELVIASRMAKGFDYSPFFALSRVTGKLKKPRKVWNIDDNATSIGLPVFATNGDVLGVLITLSGGPAEGGGGIMQMIQGPGGNIGVFMLPAKVAAKTIEQALVKAAELKEEAAKAPKEAPKEAEAKEKPAEEAPK